MAFKKGKAPAGKGPGAIAMGGAGAKPDPGRQPAAGMAQLGDDKLDTSGAGAGASPMGLAAGGPVGGMGGGMGGQKSWRR